MKAQRVIFRSQVVPEPDTWVLTEDLVPESVPHEALTAYLQALLRVWAHRAGVEALVARNLAIRLDRERPQIGLDPDVAVIVPAPRGAGKLQSLRLWEDSHRAPRLAIEVVSPNHATKDYRVAPEKYAACGAEELWVLDPLLAGPREGGGPYRIQVWRWLDAERFARIYEGEGPAWSEAVGGWVHATEGGAWFTICSDEGGQERWQTRREEAERRAEEAQRRAEAAQRRAEAAQRELVALRAQLAGGG
ncbi:MAG TPA: Uma2 family endonuclease [Candidatus Nanopelagicales bacterium]|nr:Uma2 family endonuclease [Candidatus Nanopelagicales bacterium]